MDWANIAIKAIHELAWPIVAAGIAWFFRDSIVALLPRVTKVGPVAFEPQTQRPVSAASSVTDESIERIKALVPPDLFSEARAIIENTIPRDSSGDKKNETQFLITLASTLLLTSTFDKTYANIWGSQLLLLNHLNSASPLPMPRVREFYDLAATNYPEAYANYSFEQWLNFLEAFVLIGKLEGDQIYITIRGRGFLRFLVDNGYSQFKPY